MIRRIYVEKKDGFNLEARRLKEELASFLGGKYPELTRLKDVRILRRYDVSLSDEEQFKLLIKTVFSEPQCDRVFRDTELEVNDNERCFGIELLPGQYDQRSDSAEQCAELVTGIKPEIKTSSFYIFEGGQKPLSEAALAGIKKYLINPIDSREVFKDAPPPPETSSSFDDENADPPDIRPALIHEPNLEKFAETSGLAMSMEDLLFCRNWFAEEGREPTLTELKVLDTYWSDHCRHTTFNTILDEIKIDNDGDKSGGCSSPVEKALALYEKTRLEVYGDDEVNHRKSLMDMATIGTKALKKKGLVPDLDESAEINACTIKVTADFSNGVSEPWLLLFKNETHNHPTEIEPFGGASTCLGGAIRDPLAGRAFVHQAMRVTGSGDPTAGLNTTLPGKLPQIKITREAAAGYSAYGNQIGLATGQVSEFYHPGFLAKRMELGAVIGAVPEAWVCREEPLPGDVVILVGGKTGRDGIGGATSSSRIQSGKSVESAGAEVPKGNAVEERKLLRLFRKADVSRIIKRCNDFGAGGVTVAVGELAAGLDIELDKVPKKYSGLNGTELAISESQERMAVVICAANAETFIKKAAAENLEAVVIARITAGIESADKARLRMIWRGKTIVDLSRKFLNSNGASRRASVLLKDRSSVSPSSCRLEGNYQDTLLQELASLRSGSRRGLQERFDGSVGAASVLFPWGGSEQGTPECGMAALLPSLDKQSLTASLMTFGYDPETMSHDPYSGAKGSIREALAKFACIGGDPFKARLSMQEYFGRPVDPAAWGQPAAALLGALEAQLNLGVPAVGGKDSMSGNYTDNNINLKVPPTLVAFAAGTAPAASVRSGALSGKAGNIIVLLSQSPLSPESSASEWEIFKANMKTLQDLTAARALKAAYPVGAGGVAATLAVMAFGNMTGVEAHADSFSKVDPANYQGSLLVEIDETALPKGWNTTLILAGRSIEEKIFRIVAGGEKTEAQTSEIPLEVLQRAYESPLASVYPQVGAAEPESGLEDLGMGLLDLHESNKQRFKAAAHVSGHRSPLVVLPVFPGTNCEWDMERAFLDAGAKTRLVIFRNRSRQDIDESLKELIAAFKEAQIIAFSGGFSGGDEPAGSGKFIANVIRHAPAAEAITEFLEKRDGLVLGICNGFQALIKTGLVPYGRIISPTDTTPTLTFNLIGRHVSRMVRTRVMSNISPWLNLDETGAIHTVHASHGEGRIVVSGEEAKTLFEAGQVPFCYVDAKGNPVTTEPDNPNGSAFAIEALTSPDGRVLGKMGHSERSGEFVHVNIPGKKRQRIFEAGVGYFN